MNENQHQRLYQIVGFAKSAWKMRPDDAKEGYYAGIGTYGFLEDCVTMHQVALTDVEWEVIYEIFDKTFDKED